MMNKITRNFLNLIIPNKNTRIKIRDFLYKNKLIKKPEMKLGISYSVWDGEELLEASLKSVRKNCDYINIVWQKYSWYGEPCSENLEKFLNTLKEKGLVDEIILFEPDLQKTSNLNELNKRNLGLKYVKKAKCTHFLTMDTDEFYKNDEFLNAKNYILKYGITHSICRITTYTRINYREVEPAEYFVPFIHKINRFSKLKMNACSPVPWLADATRQLPVNIFSNICTLHNISMHHYVGVRKNIGKKYKNSSANWSDEQQINTINYFNQNAELMAQNNHWIKVENIFNINID